ncbi:Detected protein of confused Function [Hibiscus syriacus]|uniref:Detected protein of confused Function n=1 Tax=Hibiscus syriacus TaxID=106335 RepID=A0A6A2WUJ1_HIBSY|nr:Detected protein of confused Function [Hibiscus syriacus]
MADSAFRKVQIQRDDCTDQAFDAYVVGKEDAPGIVVLQEWWGVDFEIKNHAVKISQLGSVCIEERLVWMLLKLNLMDGLDWQGAVKDIRASVNWLKANGSEGLCWFFIAGVTGFCMGGALSIASSVLVPEVDAVVAFYGVPSSELADPAQAKAPVQAHFGELDNFVGFADVTAAKALEEKLKASGTPYERRKDMGMADEDEAAVQLAWSRFESWMARFLSS